ATEFGNVLFVWKTDSYKIQNLTGVEKIARKLRELLELRNLPRRWKLDVKAIKHKMKSDKKAAAEYGPFLQPTGGYYELFVQPNDRFLTTFDNRRLTDTRVDLGPAPDVQDESPVA